MSQSKKDNPYKNSGNAIALRYNPEKDFSPVVVASGHGPVAEKIIQIADETGVPVYRDDSAAALLTMLEVGKNIPPELYQVVASIYVEVLKLSDEVKKKQQIL